MTKKKKTSKSTITILGEELDIKFNLGVQINYEKIAGIPFNLDDLKGQSYSIALYMAAIIAANPDTNITVERLMTEATGPEISLLNSTVTMAMIEWMEIPQVMLKPKTEENKKTEAPKNA